MGVDRQHPQVPARAHGGLIPEELAALASDDVDIGDRIVDFSVNVNPYGPAPAMREVISKARIDLYPDSTACAARRALASDGGVTADRVVLGEGGAALLWTLARVLVPADRAVLIVEPTFSEFRAAVEATRGRIVEWRASVADGFAVDLAAVTARARACEAAALYLCTPNNPTGRPVRAAAVRALAAALPDVMLIVDQAFLSLSEHHADAVVDMPANVVRVRSLTKEHTIPGVRVGYLIATPAVAAAVEHARPAWSTSAAAQAAALASVLLAAFVADSRQRLLDDRRALAAGLRALGLAPLPSSAAFCLCAVADAAGLRRALLTRHHLLVRDCASFGLPGYIRLAARPAADRLRLLAALREELG
jgi:histidinol-phosphate/aromatic aminotransferase/cobyric acid decarboxylase-like protein